MGSSDGGPIPGVTSNGRSFKILVADDEELHRVVAQSLLQVYGYEVHTVSNGLEAYESVSKVEYDAVLMDCCMPTMDGLEATAKIRTLKGRNGSVPIIAYTTQRNQEACLTAGMNDYLYKPAPPEKLHASLEQWTAAEGSRGRS